MTAEWQDNVRCLEQGFEPFAVDRQFIYFKRLKPCETCEHKPYLHPMIGKKVQAYDPAKGGVVVGTLLDVFTENNKTHHIIELEDGIRGDSNHFWAVE